jgi:hypothetical protein
LAAKLIDALAARLALRRAADGRLAGETGVESSGGTAAGGRIHGEARFSRRAAHPIVALAARDAPHLTADRHVFSDAGMTHFVALAALVDATEPIGRTAARRKRVIRALRPCWAALVETAKLLVGAAPWRIRGAIARHVHRTAFVATDTREGTAFRRGELKIAGVARFRAALVAAAPGGGAALGLSGVDVDFARLR